MENEDIIQQIRKETDIFNKAKLITTLVRTNKVRIIDLAKKLSIKPSYLCHILRLNKIPELIIDGYYAQNISLSHLFVISRLNDKKQMIDIYEKLLTNPITVLQTEEMVREILYGTKSIGQYLSKKEIHEFIDTSTLNKKDIIIKIIQTRIKSKCIIEFKGSLENTSRNLRKIMRAIEGWYAQSEK